ncbi:MAG: DUF937 domain-containing protein [Xanthomonadaceae bacterium]|nr:DUF937 domain-containing protein [Xanthomonadaceae bacterium]
MRIDILESLNAALGTPVVRQLSSLFGENEDSTRAALRTTGPSLLAGLMHRAANPSGVEDIYSAVNDERLDGGIVSKLGGILGNRGAIDSMQSVGASLLGSLFGNRTGALSSAISQVTGVRASSASSLMSFALPIMLGILRKHVSTSGLNSSGLASLLFSQRGALERTGLDNRITSALGFSNLSSLLKEVPAPGEPSQPERVLPERRHERESRRSWLPWAAAAGVAALALLLIFNRPDDTANLESSAQVTTGAESARVYFGSGEATIDDGDRVKIASVAEAAKRAGRSIRITGYTDRSGDPSQNETIAKNRAAAVRDALLAEGVDESQIVMDPPARLTGTGTDDEARRVDIAMR